MPELPEVETIRRALVRHAVGRSVHHVDGRSVQMRRPLRVDRLRRHLAGHRIEGVRRRGKFLLIDIDTPGVLLVHLGMSGRLMLCAPGTTALPHTHLVLALEPEVELRLVDPRRFGLVDWLEPGEETHDPSLCGLGLEPLADDMTRLLPTRLRRSGAPLKAALLDQRLVAGVGNIYATEALWRAGVRPSRRGRDTALARLERLSSKVRQVIEEAVAEGGTTIRDFATPEGNFGYFAVRLQAYGRAGLPCVRCGVTLRDSRLGGRSTVWCPGCQR